MSARRALPAVALLALLALAATGVGVALVSRGEAPARPAGPRAPVAPSPAAATDRRSASSAPDRPAPTAARPDSPPGAASAAAPGAAEVEAPAEVDASEVDGAEAPGPPAPLPAGTFLLTGRLVATRLEWAWVEARPAWEHDDPDAQAEEPEEYDEALRDDPDDLRTGPDGVALLAPCLRDLPGAGLGRPGGGWAVPHGATRVGPDGAFSLRLRAGPWVVVAGARGCATRAERLVLVADRDVTWPLAYAPPATLVLTCTSADDVPLAGAALSLELMTGPLADALGDGPWGSFPDPQERAARAHLRRVLDAAGRLRLELPAGDVTLGEGTLCSTPTARVQLGRGARTPGASLSLAPGERRELTLRALPASGVRLDVRVVSPDGAPVPGAAARLTEWLGPAWAAADGATAEADAEGRLVFLGVEPGGWCVAARGGGRAGCSPALTVAAGDGPREVRVVLTDEDSWGGVSLDVRAQEAPTRRLEQVWLPGADGVRVQPGAPTLVDGPCGARTIDVVAPGRAARRVQVELRRGRPERVEVRLAPAAVVRGRLEPPAQAEVTLVADDAELATMWSDAKDGAFAFDTGPAAGQQVELRVRAEGRFEHRVRLQAPAEEVVVRLPDAPRTEVLVAEADGSPATARVMVVAGGRLVAEGWAEEGRLVLRGPAPPGATVRAWNAERELPLAPGVALRLCPSAPYEPPVHLERTSHVEGAVVDGEGRPVPRAKVEVSDPHGGYEWALTDAAGRFHLPAAPGRIEVVAARIDLGRDAVQLDVPADGATVRVTLAGCVQVSVRAPPGADQVVLSPVEEAPGSRLATGSGPRRADGTFDLGRVRPGRWRVTAWPPDEGKLAWRRARPIAEREVDVVAPGPVLLDLGGP